MIERQARCHCGQLQLRCLGDPRKVSMCHCLECQLRTGSTFSIAAFYERSRVWVEQGAARTYVRDSATGFPVAFHFCGDCGANVYWEPARLPDLLGIAVGAFGDPDFPHPQQSVWTRDKHRWIELPKDTVIFDINVTP